MPWYRAFASHGPGHQSSTEFYRFYFDALDTKQKRKDAWDDAFDNGSYDCPCGDVELCEKLPQNVYDEKLAGFRSSIDYAHRMLEVMRNTPTKPVIAVRLETKVAVSKPGNPTRAWVTGYQARLFAEPSVSGPLKPKREEAVNALLSMFRRENRKVLQAKKGATRHSRRRDYAVITR